MLKEPESMDKCIYFTRRALDPKGSIRAWVYRKECPECHKAEMGKPIDPKTGKVKSRSDIYVCPECSYEEAKKEHEESLTVEAIYVCPHCDKEGEGSTQFKRKTFEGVPSYLLECQHCGGKIAITKKMKKSKKK